MCVFPVDSERKQPWVRVISRDRWEPKLMDCLCGEHIVNGRPSHHHISTKTSGDVGMVSCELVAIATATMSNPTASVMCHAGNVDVTSECCEAPCLFHALIILLPVYRSCKYLPNPNLNISQWGFIILT